MALLHPRLLALSRQKQKNGEEVLVDLFYRMGDYHVLTGCDHTDCDNEVISEY